MTRNSNKAFTMIELLVALIIIGLLATIAVNVFIQRVTLAKIAAAKAQIQQFEVAIAQYEIDTGSVPPSGTGTLISPNQPNPTAPANGMGYLYLALSRSLNGDVTSPLDPRWKGPYIEATVSQTGRLNGDSLDGTETQAEIQILDPWGNAYTYIRAADYVAMGGTETTDSAFQATETYFNPSTWQIFSKGPNGATNDPPTRGLDYDDVTNFKR